MQDETGKRPAAGYVRHLKEESQVLIYGSNPWKTNSGNGYYDISSSNPDMWLYYATDVIPYARITPSTQKLPGVVSCDFGDIPDAQQVQELYEKATRTVADMLLNWVELEQLANLPRTFGDYSTLRDRWSRMNRAAQDALHLGGGTVGKRGSVLSHSIERFSKTSLKKLSDLHLATSFGILPILSDISALSAQWSKIGDMYNRLKQNPRQRRQITVKGNLQMVPTSQTGQGSTDEFMLSHTAVEAVRRYVLVYDYILPNIMNEQFQKMTYYASRLSTGPASLVYELIPYSFVIDWVLDVRSLLMSLDNLFGPNPIKTVSLSKSEKIRCLAMKTHTVYSNCTQREFLRTDVGSSEYSSYERVGLTRSNYLGLSHRFGIKQALLSLSLVYQKLI